MGPHFKRNTHAQLQIPDAFLPRANLVVAADSDAIVVDSAPLEFEDSIEYLTNVSKSYGSLPKQEQRDALATRGSHLLRLPNEDSDNTLLENMGCIYKCIPRSKNSRNS